LRRVTVGVAVDRPARVATGVAVDGEVAGWEGVAVTRVGIVWPVAVAGGCRVEIGVSAGMDGAVAVPVGQTGPVVTTVGGGAGGDGVALTAVMVGVGAPPVLDVWGVFVASVALAAGIIGGVAVGGRDAGMTGEVAVANGIVVGDAVGEVVAVAVATGVSLVVVLVGAAVLVEAGVLVGVVVGIPIRVLVAMGSAAAVLVLVAVAVLVFVLVAVLVFVLVAVLVSVAVSAGRIAAVADGARVSGPVSVEMLAAALVGGAVDDSALTSFVESCVLAAKNAARSSPAGRGVHAPVVPSNKLAPFHVSGAAYPAPCQ